MRNLHLVYAGNPNSDDPRAPFTISRHLYRHLKPKFKQVFYYDWCHRAKMAPVAKTDVILAHPNYPEDTAARRLFKSATPHKFLIFPLHHGIPKINLPFDDLVKQAKRVFSITGPYWYDTLENSPFAHWKPKITRVDMAINVNTFPFSRERFHSRGHREFACVTNDRPEKGLGILAKLFGKVPYKLHLYGNIDGQNPLLKLKNVTYHGYAHISPHLGKRICSQADFFINTSVSDANPTVCLEAAAWGLVVACTKESGYYGGRDKINPCLGLNGNNLDVAASQLRDLNNLSNDDLWKQAKYARGLVERHYTWDRFCKAVWDGLNSML